MRKRLPDSSTWSCGPNWINDDHQAVYSRMIQTPEDDAPRLILTDIFEEEGQDRGKPHLVALAKFIRIQIEMAARIDKIPFTAEANDLKEWKKETEAEYVALTAQRREIHSLSQETEYADPGHPIAKLLGGFKTKQSVGIWIRRGFLEALPCLSGGLEARVGDGVFERFPITRVVMPDRLPRAVYLPETWEETSGGELRRVEARQVYTWTRAEPRIRIFSPSLPDQLPAMVYDCFADWPGRGADPEVREEIQKNNDGTVWIRFEFLNVFKARQVLGWALAEYARRRSGLGPDTPWRRTQGLHRAEAPRSVPGEFDHPGRGIDFYTVRLSPDGVMAGGYFWTLETMGLFPEVGGDGRVNYSRTPAPRPSDQDLRLFPSDFEEDLEPRDAYFAVISTVMTLNDWDEVVIEVTLQAREKGTPNGLPPLPPITHTARTIIRGEDLNGSDIQIASVRRRTVQRLQRETDIAFGYATGGPSPDLVSVNSWFYGDGSED